jgi:hypothetical protein
MEMLEAAIAKGSHPLARVPEAAAQLRGETLEKVEQGYARLELWEKLKKKTRATSRYLRSQPSPTKAKHIDAFWTCPMEYGWAMKNSLRSTNQPTQ